MARLDGADVMVPPVTAPKAGARTAAEWAERLRADADAGRNTLLLIVNDEARDLAALLETLDGQAAALRAALIPRIRHREHCLSRLSQDCDCSELDATKALKESRP